MRWKLLVAIFIFFMILSPKSFWEYTTAQINQIYEKLYTKILVSVWNWIKTTEKIWEFLDKKSETADKNLLKILNDLKKENNEKYFSLKMESEKSKIEKQLWKFKVLDNFKNKLLNDSRIVNENWVWYWYVYDNYNYFWKDSELNQANLDYNKVDKENDLVGIKDWNVIFVKDYKKYRLIADWIIYWIPGKKEFLETLVNIKHFDKKEENLDKDFIILRALSKRLTEKSQKKEEIIKILYNYILENLKYDEELKEGNYNIFSGIKTFKDKVWVCQWYVELLTLMLAFNNIKAEIIKWDVVNSRDFPKIWHAWIKIDNFYYDPTFDDPLWAKTTKKFEDYYYYKIPRDIFYTNRFDLWKTPEFLKKLTLEQRQTYVDQNIYSLYNKYKDSNLNILNVVKFKKLLWLSAKEEINLNSVIKKFWFSEIWENWKVEINGETRYIEKMNYFEINDKHISSVMHQINFKMEDYKIFKIKENSKEKYLISNDYKLR